MPLDPPEPHHITACLPQLQLAMLSIILLVGDGYSSAVASAFIISTGTWPQHKGLGNWNWSRNFSWLLFYRNNLLDVIISHWLSHELEEGGGHFGAGVLELKELSLLLFVSGAPPDWF